MQGHALPRERRTLFIACSLIYAAIMLAVTVSAVAHPFYNWDIMGYVGSVVAWSAPDRDAIFTRAIQAVHDGIPEWVYAQHIVNPLCANSIAYAQQLPNYQIKPLYNAAIWLGYHAGLTLPAASWVTSAVSFLLLALMLWLWTPRALPRSLWLLLVVMLTFLFPMAMYSLARLSTPDALGTLFCIAMLYCRYSHRGELCFGACALLAQLARPDAIILSGLFIAYFTLVAPAQWRMKKITAFLWLCVLASAYMTVTHLAHAYRLETYFIYSFLDRMQYPAESERHLAFAEYWNVLRYSVPSFLSVPRTMAMIAWSGAAVLCHFLRRAPQASLDFHMLLLSWTALCARFLLYPSWGDDRYYFVYFIIMLYSGGEMMAYYAIVRREAYKERYASMG